jgi:hypothetical protein
LESILSNDDIYFLEMVFLSVLFCKVKTFQRKFSEDKEHTLNNWGSTLYTTLFQTMLIMKILSFRMLHLAISEKFTDMLDEPGERGQVCECSGKCCN